MFILFSVKYHTIAPDGTAKRAIWVIHVSLEIFFFFKYAFKQNGKTKLLCMCAHCYFPTCCSLQVCTIVHTLMPVSCTKAKIHSTFNTSDLSFFSIKVTLRASLPRPSYCLVINSCSCTCIGPLWHHCKYWRYVSNHISFYEMSLGGHMCLQLANTASMWRYNLCLLKANGKVIMYCRWVGWCEDVGALQSLLFQQY